MNTIRPLAMLFLALMAFALGGYLFIRWRDQSSGSEREDDMGPVGFLFVGQFMHAVIDFIMEQALQPAPRRRAHYA